MANKRKVNIEEATTLRRLGWSCADIAHYFGSSEGYVRNHFGTVKKDIELMIKKYEQSKSFQTAPDDNSAENEFNEIKIRAKRDGRGDYSDE
jgi:alanine racemase